MTENNLNNDVRMAIVKKSNRNLICRQQDSWRFVVLNTNKNQGSQAAYDTEDLILLHRQDFRYDCPCWDLREAVFRSNFSY